MTPLPRLTLRKVTILLHLEAGQSYKEIARDLSIHENTVHLHIREMANVLPGKGAPKERVMLWCERLLVAHADIVAGIRNAA